MNSSANITQMLYNPHLNGSNATQARLEKKLASRRNNSLAVSTVATVEQTPRLPYATNLLVPTSDNGTAVVEVSSQTPELLSDVVTTYQNKNPNVNITVGGVCHNTVATLFATDECDTNEAPYYHAAVAANLCNNDLSNATLLASFAFLDDYCNRNKAANFAIGLEIGIPILVGICVSVSLLSWYYSRRNRNQRLLDSASLQSDDYGSVVSSDTAAPALIELDETSVAASASNNTHFRL